VTLYNTTVYFLGGSGCSDVAELGPGAGPGSVPAVVGSMVGVLLVLWELGDLKQMLAGSWEEGWGARPLGTGGVDCFISSREVSHRRVVGVRVEDRGILRRVWPWGGA
jgi:hypothetical protein